LDGIEVHHILDNPYALNPLFVGGFLFLPLFKLFLFISFKSQEGGLTRLFISITSESVLPCIDRWGNPISTNTKWIKSDPI
jgi:hypothetical protein